MPISSENSADANASSMRRGKAVGDQVDHRRLELVGVAEVEPRRIADEARELDDDRIVQAELLAQRGALLGGRLDADHLVDRIADEAEQRERDQRHREHHHDGLQQAANDEGEHHGDLRSRVIPNDERRGRIA